MHEAWIGRCSVVCMLALACGDDTQPTADASADAPAIDAAPDAAAPDAPAIDAPAIDAPAGDAEMPDGPRTDAEVADGGSPPGFGAAMTFTVGTAAGRLAIGDFNEDGQLDVATLNHDASTLVTLLGNGDGTLGSLASQPIGPYATALLTADFNHDRHLDLAVGFHQPVSSAQPMGWVTVFAGDGAGSFTVNNTYDAFPGVSDLVAADVNGDGNLDIVFAASDASVTASVITTLLGNGDETFAAPRQSQGPPLAVGLTVGQFTSDSVPDVVASNGLGYGVTLMRGVGDGSFQFVSNYPSGGAAYVYSWAVVARDFDGDGALDLAVGQGDSTLSILRGGLTGGSPDGTFGAPTTYSATGGSSIAAADYNGDGNLDLAIVRGAGVITVVLGDGRAGFTLDRNYASGGYAGSVAAGDFNSDGKPDLVVANRYGTIAILLNQYP